MGFPRPRLQLRLRSRRRGLSSRTDRPTRVGGMRLGGALTSRRLAAGVEVGRRGREGGGPCGGRTLERRGLARGEGDPWEEKWAQRGGGGEQCAACRTEEGAGRPKLGGERGGEQRGRGTGERRRLEAAGPQGGGLLGARWGEEGARREGFWNEAVVGGGGAHAVKVAGEAPRREGERVGKAEEGRAGPAERAGGAGREVLRDREEPPGG